MTSSDPYVPLIVIGIIVLLVFLGGRPRGDTPAADEPPSGAELIERLQRTLGIAIVVGSVESVDPGPAGPVTIWASFMSGRHTTSVRVTGPTESDAWAALARAAIEWRNSDFQHVPIWPVGG